MENHENMPHDEQGGQMHNEDPQGDDAGGSNTIMIVLLIIIVLAIGFILLGGMDTPEDAMSPVDEGTTTEQTVPAEDVETDTDSTSTEVDGSVDAQTE